MDYSKIAKQLSEAFESSGLSYGDLSERTGIAKSALHRYLSGDTRKIPVDRLNDICNALGINPREVVGWDDHQEKNWQLDLEMFGKEKPPDKYLEDIPKTEEARILSRGIDQLPEEQRKQAVAMFDLMFSKFIAVKEKNENES